MLDDVYSSPRHRSMIRRALECNAAGATFTQLPRRFLPPRQPHCRSDGTLRRGVVTLASLNRHERCFLKLAVSPVRPTPRSAERAIGDNPRLSHIAVQPLGTAPRHHTVREAVPCHPHPIPCSSHYPMISPPP